MGMFSILWKGKGYFLAVKKILGKHLNTLVGYRCVLPHEAWGCWSSGWVRLCCSVWADRERSGALHAARGCPWRRLWLSVPMFGGWKLMDHSLVTVMSVCMGVGACSTCVCFCVGVTIWSTCAWFCVGVGAYYICVCFSVGLGIYSMHALFFCGCRYMFYTCFTFLWCRYMFQVFAFVCM